MNRSTMLIFVMTAPGVIISSTAQADNRAGVEAWTRGEFATAVAQWQGDVAKGDADAMFNLAQAYKLGRGVPQDLVKAEALYGHAAALGHLQASDMYGLLLFQRGDQAKAMPYVEASASRGDPRAQYLLGVAHFNGKLVNKDWVRAYALVSLAQQEGVAAAAQALSQMDVYIPIDQRQRAAALAIDLKNQADAQRNRQLAAIDLGVQGSANHAPPFEASNAASEQQVPIADSPATAGADYARPVNSRPPAIPPPIHVATSTTPPATPLHRAVAAPASPAGVAGGSWRIQLGAFGVAANADALWARLKSRPELIGHPRTKSNADAVIKLQAGGFANQSAAQTACKKLIAAGYTCIPVGG